MNELASTEITVTFDVVWEQGKLLSATTNSQEINHFLDLLKLTQSYNTWVNYLFDLKCFFTVIAKPPDAITRADCLVFMQAQDQAGYADATINRRLAAVSSLFSELTLLDSKRFPQPHLSTTIKAATLSIQTKPVSPSSATGARHSVRR